MSTTSRSPFADDELVELLSEQPELLAIADALVASKRAERDSAARLLRRRRRTPLVSVAALIAAGAAVALLLISPWAGGPSVVQQALAAVGDQPVLHVVVAEPLGGGALIELNSGRPIPRSLKTEIWFDSQRDLKKTVFTLDGELVDEQLETETGGWSRSGPIYTCAWIARHPLEASRAGVSCQAGGTGPAGTLPEQSPTLDPALAEFVDQYRSALASGKAVASGNGKVDGRDVVWLEFATGSALRRVAVDALTYRPVAAEANDGTVRFRVLTAETLPYQQGFFTKPERLSTQTGGSIVSEAAVDPERAAAILAGRALWLGPEWRGLKLISVTRQERTIAYGPGTEAGRATAIKLSYAPAADAGAADLRSTVEIYEATSCLVSTGWTCTPRDPSDAGTLGLPLGERGQVLLYRDGLYVSIWGADALPQVSRLELVQALERVANP